MSNFEIADRLDNIDTQIEIANKLLEIGVDDILLSYDKIDPCGDTEKDRIQIASLCHDLPKVQAVLMVAQKEILDIQNQVKTLHEKAVTMSKN